MSRPSKRQRRARAWTLALVGSFWAHAALLGALVALGGRAWTHQAEVIAVELVPAAAAPASAAATPGEVLPDPPLPARDEVVAPLLAAGEPADRDDAVAVRTAPRRDEGRDRATPAPDQGELGGPPAERAYRSDRSTLRSRLDDGSADSQPSRLRTARRSSSPQAVRREARTGIGDSVATTVPSRLPSAARPETPPATAGAGAGAAPGSGEPARVDSHPEVTRVSDRPALERGVGPLAVEAGARMFDTERPGPAADDHTLRAASNERHPSVTDFSRAGVAGPGDQRDGRGPGQAPGATALRTDGTALNRQGDPKPEAIGVDLARQAREREYYLYNQEIQQRVARVLVFPKVLALRLEQGETIINFAVRPDGWLGEGPRVVKSSGFQEFDAEAVKAVLRAAPFPRRSDTLRVSMRVPFENPLIR